MTLADQLIEQINNMDEIQQQQLLNFARTLSKKPLIAGESGSHIIQSTALFDAQSLDEIETAISEGCEEIDWRDWE